MHLTTMQHIGVYQLMLNVSGAVMYVFTLSTVCISSCVKCDCNTQQMNKQNLIGLHFPTTLQTVLKILKNTFLKVTETQITFNM